LSTSPTAVVRDTVRSIAPRAKGMRIESPGPIP
jgi:hypothetical protein